VAHDYALVGTVMPPEIDREPALIYLKVEPVWDPLRAQPEFQKIERSMGLM